MQHNSPFSIYNASAGSGKTFTLVKSYLIKILSTNKPDGFKNILAITFTNKAVNEMKERILENLFSFSKTSIIECPSFMFEMVCKETQLSAHEVNIRAKKAVHYILHNYSSFDVETIDRFNHRLIRTFARDLKLATNFEVELDLDLLMSEAINLVISQVGKDEKLTSTILDFSLEKLEDDKSWDIIRDLKEISQLLYNENALPHFEKLKGKNIDDFLLLKKTLFQKKQQAEKELQLIAQDFLTLLSENGLAFSDFDRKSLPGFFDKISTGNYNVISGATWQKSLGESALYPKRVPAEIAAIIEKHTPQFVDMFHRSKALIFHVDFLNLLLRNVNPLSLLNVIYKEYLALQEEKNVLPISEFNKRINNEIKGQPAPFIYERLGERYNHFFIDEFQDTSRLQWENLVPLIDNALSQTAEAEMPGSLLLVGDAKQSIYRWRGGDPEQFIDLYGKENPFFATEKNVETLDTNFRSFEEVIQFNNFFFSYVSEHFQSIDHSHLYKIGNAQKKNYKQGGYVSISFIEAKNKVEGFEVYPQKVLEIVNSLIEKGYLLSDICVLVRKNNQGVAIAEVLSNHNINVVSSEALLLEHVQEINFIINILKLLLNFEDKKAKAAVLYFLHPRVNTPDALHDFIAEFLPLKRDEFRERLRFLSLNFDFDATASITIYDLCESVCKTFLSSSANIAYIQSFLEFVYEFSLSQSTTVSDFLNHWEVKKSKLSVDVSDLPDAINIMTIHKAKGLEFPVVIYPFADDDFYSFRNDNLWFPLDETNFSGFSEMLIPVSSKLENFGEIGRSLFNDHKIKAELDKTNLVYVAMTRAIEQLFIITNFVKAEKKENVAFLYSGFLKSRGLWDETVFEYEFGLVEKPVLGREEILQVKTHFFESFPKSPYFKDRIKIATQNAFLWDTRQEKAIEKGALLHNLLSKIISRKDILPVLNTSLSEGIITEEQYTIVYSLFEKITSHSFLSVYFEEGVSVENERDIYSKTQEIQRPDRINYIDSKTVSLIDYKTGNENPGDVLQIRNYGVLLSEMGFQVKELLLVYIKDKIEVVNVEKALLN